MGDFQVILGLNLQQVWSGEISVRRALLLVEQLLSHPESRFRAEFQGEQISVWHWPHTQKVLADLYDMQKSLLAAFGGVTLDDSDLYPRPHLARDEPATAVPTIAEWDVDGFMRQINS